MNFKSIGKAKDLIQSGELTKNATLVAETLSQINVNQLEIEKKILTLQNNQCEINECLNNMEEIINKIHDQIIED